jgi:N-acetylglucosamine kinase-like BadF-type ATPase
MTVVLREADGRGAATALTGCLLDYLGLSDRMELDRMITIIYQQPTDRSRIAEFARMVTRTAAWELSLAARAVLAKLDYTAGPGKVIITGGVFDAAPLVRKLFVTDLKRSVPGFTVARPRFKSVVGALLLALKKVNGALNEKLLERMATGLPEELQG